MSFIIWDIDPALFNTDSYSPRWYGVMFALAFLLSQQIMIYIFKKEGKEQRDLDDLTIYLIVATVLGARFGHVLFYEPEKYWPNVWDVFKIWEGGLASHGAAIGIILAIWIYTKYEIKILKFKAIPTVRKGQNFWWVVDRIVIVVAIAGCCIRLGNFINSEIVGKPSEAPYAVVFGRWAEEATLFQDGVESAEVSKSDTVYRIETGRTNVMITVGFDNTITTEAQAAQKSRDIISILPRYPYAAKHIQPSNINGGINHFTVSKGADGFEAKLYMEGIPRHAAQLYESISCLILFFVLFFIWNRYKSTLPDGLLFGVFLIILFGLRFLYEFIKENQVAFEDDIALNMGQWLSIPLVLVGIVVVIRALRQTKKAEA